jgi:hypothetical protein
MAKPRSIESILLHLDKIKASMAKGHIFRTGISIGQWLEIYIFDMMAGKKHITAHNLCQWANYNRTANKHASTNNAKAKEVFAMWKAEIEEHNNALFKNQKSLF